MSTRGWPTRRRALSTSKTSERRIDRHRAERRSRGRRGDGHRSRRPHQRRRFLSDAIGCAAFDCGCVPRCDVDGGARKVSSNARSPRRTTPSSRPSFRSLRARDIEGLAMPRYARMLLDALFAEDLIKPKSTWRRKTLAAWCRRLRGLRGLRSAAGENSAQWRSHITSWMSLPSGPSAAIRSRSCSKRTGSTAAKCRQSRASSIVSETVFVLTPTSPGHTARIRIFTPSRELPFAGHPTIGTAILLAELRTPLLNGERDAIIALEEEVGSVRVGVRLRAGAAPLTASSMRRKPRACRRACRSPKKCRPRSA